MFENLSIFPATREQAVETRRRSYESWGRPFGVDSELYLDREGTYGGIEMVQESRWTVWILAPRDDPETLNFYCACETLRRETIVSTQADSHCGAQSQVGYGVASVYTPPEYRGKGYAKHMMRLLHWVLAPADSFSAKFPEAWGLAPAVPEGFGTAVVSVLYSDVGSEFYKAAGPVPGEDGWVLGTHIITTWNVATAPTSTAASQWTWLGKEQLKSVWERDSEAIIKETPSLTRKGFTFLPRKGLGEYLYRRTDWFIAGMENPPKYWGMDRESNGDEGEETRPFVTWSFEMYPGQPKTLLITRLRCPKETFSDLILALLGYAKEIGIDKVQAWNLPKELKEESVKTEAESVAAEEHLACLKWYGEGASAVEWLNSEKFAWC